MDTYVNMFNTRNPDIPSSLILTFTNRYEDGEVARGIAKALEAGHSKDILKKMQGQQFEGWLNSPKSVDDVFAIFKIEQDIKEVLANPDHFNIGTCRKFRPGMCQISYIPALSGSLSWHSAGLKNLT
ncbi:hypothetical protein PHMEG_00034531 [Phytophthora megakarya]|uniref:Avirulence (Avh) protein n=1 Tax=Phytophthora megakarya TaxID=4795 RepID=A0A225UR88_9STRA|nr:hypothetical protein PHMEG_00034531 [Phytophthora megakarya]